MTVLLTTKPFTRTCPECYQHIQQRELLYEHLRTKHRYSDINASVFSDGGQSKHEEGLRLLKLALKASVVESVALLGYEETLESE